MITEYNVQRIYWWYKYILCGAWGTVCPTRGSIISYSFFVFIWVLVCFIIMKVRRSKNLVITLDSHIFRLPAKLSQSVTPATVRGSVVTCCCLYVVLLKEREENNQRIFGTIVRFIFIFIFIFFIFFSCVCAVRRRQTGGLDSARSDPASLPRPAHATTSRVLQ